MKLSLKWLQRHVDLSGLEPRQILDDLTMSTAEIEGIETFGGGLDALVVGHVVEHGAHPDADKLSVCRVDVGAGEPVQIVCGAPNVGPGQKVAVIRPGDKLPDVDGSGSFKIKKAKIRGVESFGMICSERELGLSEEHEGIMVLDPALATGTRFVDAVPVVDHVLEIDNKSINHRPDLWGHFGFARELAAIYGRELRPLCKRIEFPATGKSVAVQIEDLQACPRYTGLVIEGVQAMPSPDWLRYLLQAVGQRSIDLLVDLTNFVMLDLGQPMHAFDLRDIEGRTVGIRHARHGESLTTLDGFARELLESDLLITAADKPVALAGVMGGEGTMVEPGTTALFLESANFHPTTIRRTSVRLGLRTDASARFEKALDPEYAELAVHQFVGMLGELCPGAHAAGPLSDPAGWTFTAPAIALRRSRLDLKLGVHVDDAQVRSILENLEFEVEDADDGFGVRVPSHRATKDIAIEDDLIEEVGRMFRYDNIPEQPLEDVVTVPPREDELFLARRALEIAATELSCNEVYNYSFVPDALLVAVAADDQPYGKVTNPVAPEITAMRRHVLPSTLSSLRANLQRRHADEVRLMEHGKGYHPERRDGDGLPHEVRELAFAWGRATGEAPYGELRSGLEHLLQRLGYPAVIDAAMTPGDLAWIHPGRTAAIRRGEAVVGYVGTLHPLVARNLDLPQGTAIGSLDLRALLASGYEAAQYRAVPAFPSQPVDIALFVDEATRVGDVAAFLRRAGKKLVRSVELFEVYRGQGVADGRKSLNFTVTLGAADRTLTAKDEEKYIVAVRAGAGELGAELRG